MLGNIPLPKRLFSAVYIHKIDFVYWFGVIQIHGKDTTYVNQNTSLFTDNEGDPFHMMRRLMSFKWEQREVDNFRIFFSEGWLIISVLNIHHSVNKYFLSTCFPNQKDLYRLFLFPRFIVSLSWIPDRACHCSLDTHPLALSVYGHVYVCEFHKEINTITLQHL